MLHESLTSSHETVDEAVVAAVKTVMSLNKERHTILARLFQHTEHGEVQRYPGHEDDSEHFRALSRTIIDRVHALGSWKDPRRRIDLLRSMYGYSGKVVARGRREVACINVPKEDLQPYFGMAMHEMAFVREGLHPAVHRFVKEHELKHVDDWNFAMSYHGPAGWLFTELRASTHGLYDIGGLMATIWSLWKDPARSKSGIRRLFRKDMGGTQGSEEPCALFEKVQDLHPLFDVPSDRA